MRRRLGLLAAALIAAFAASAAPAPAATPTATPVARLPFPERGFVVDVPAGWRVAPSALRVRENGRTVPDVRVSELSATTLRSGVVLAIDASESMAGRPFAGALAAARAFVGRVGARQQIGLVAFNGGVRVLQRPTADRGRLVDALASPPPLSYGTRIYDALVQAVDLVQRSQLSIGSIVVLSDGADIGSSEDIAAVVATADRHNVRIFTVGLRSGAYESSALRAIASRTGGAYVEARTAGDLVGIYRVLGERLAREYLVQYRSDAPVESRVAVEIDVGGVGVAKHAYVAPSPSRVAPYHRSALARFLLSPASVALLALLGGGLVAWLVLRLARRPQNGVVERIGAFSTVAPRPSPVAAPQRRRPRYTSGRWARLERELEIARVGLSPQAAVAWTLAATLAVVVVLALLAKVLAVLGLLVPLAASALLRRKLKRLRDDFNDQLPANLQVLASALRAGHSFSGALGVVVENAHEPARSELMRILRDDQFGVPPEEAIRSVAKRMASRDLEQVALLAELQRTSGGNAAEVLDTVVFTIRERSELRRLVRTLTAQGRMARWILTALPIALTGALWLMHPDVMGMFFESTSGQVALVVAALMVAAGSALIQRIVDIDV